MTSYHGTGYDSSIYKVANKGVLESITYTVSNAYIVNDGYVNFIFRSGSASTQYLYMDSASIEITLDDTLLPIPDAPTNLTGSPEIGAITLSWTGATGATSYNVYRSTVSGSGYELITNTGQTIYVDHISNTDSTTYYYVVTAQNEVGTSEYSNEATAQAIPEPIPEPQTRTTAEYTERNIFIPEQYWTGDGINQEAREIIVKKYNAGPGRP